jgi:hypothetical protein
MTKPAVKSRLVRAGRDLSIAANQVEAMHWERRDYMNGSGPSFLIVTMISGAEHRIEHCPQYLDGTDAYAVEREIHEANLFMIETDHA